MTVGTWRKRYRELGLKGLYDKLCPGRPRTYEEVKVAEVIDHALQTKPAYGSTQWWARSLAAAKRNFKTTGHRGCRPSRSKHTGKHHRCAEA